MNCAAAEAQRDTVGWLAWEAAAAEEGLGRAAAESALWWGLQAYLLGTGGCVERHGQDHGKMSAAEGSCSADAGAVDAVAVLLAAEEACCRAGAAGEAVCFADAGVVGCRGGADEECGRA